MTMTQERVSVLIQTDIPEMVLVLHTGGHQWIGILVREYPDEQVWLYAPFSGVEHSRINPVRDYFTRHGVRIFRATPSEFACESIEMILPSDIPEEWLPAAGWRMPSWVEFPDWATP